MFTPRFANDSLPKNLTMTSVVLAFFERADAGANLRFRFDFMLVQKKWPGAIGIFQPRIVTPATCVGHGFDGRDAHHQELILASPFELNR